MVIEKSVSKAMNARIHGSSSSSTGEGKETIVLAHGYGGDQSIWDKVVSSNLAMDYQVLVFDWCFSGAVTNNYNNKESSPNVFDAEKYSTYQAFADDLIALMEEMKLDSTVFVGHSMSGMIGCIASVKKPLLFSKLLLVGSSPRYLNAENYEGGFEMEVIEQLFISIKSNYEQWATAFASAVVDGSDPNSVEKFANSLKKMGSNVAHPLAKTVFLSDHRSILEKVTAPCTIVHTVNDVVVPDSVPSYMMKMIKGESTVEIIQTRGHFPQLTAHDQFLQVLDKVMKKN